MSACNKPNALTACHCVLQEGHEGCCSCGKRHKKKCTNPGGHIFEVACEGYEAALCPVPCDFLLSCGHRCPGTCGECVPPEDWKGVNNAEYMVHRRCTDHCGKHLPCGHFCRDGCGKSCLPCQEPCSFFCGHTQCTGDHKCSDCSNKCSKRCLWHCPHYECMKQCHEVCDRPRCDEKCTKTLPCGHPCVGVCGEVCPRFCPACLLGGGGEEAKRQQQIEMEKIYRDDVYIMESDLRDEDNGNAVNPNLVYFFTSNPESRVLALPCCPMYMSVGFADRYIHMCQEKSTLLIPGCPLCGQSWRPTSIMRYGTYIRQLRQELPHIFELQRKERREIEKVNRQSIIRLTNTLRYGFEASDEKLNEEDPAMEQYWEHMQKRAAVEKSGNVEAIAAWKAEVMQLREPVEKKIYRGNWRISSLQDFRLLLSWCLNVQPEQPCVSDTVSAFFNYLQMRRPTDLPERMAYIYTAAQEYCQYLLKNLTLDDAVTKQVALTVEWLCCFYTACVADVKRGRGLLTIKHKAFFHRFYLPPPDKYTKMAVDVKSLEKLLEDYGRPARERFDRNFLLGINRALGLTAGAWFRCPNGHLYAIGECGGAMQHGTCPECGNAIGGQQHAVERTNEFAGGLFEDKAQPKYPQNHLNLN